MEIVRTVFGSQLYGTNGPNSDQDFKRIVLPTWEQVALGKIGKGKNETTGTSDSKNRSDDIDMETFTIHQFVNLALQGQTVAFDMLHSPSNMIVTSGPIWDDLVANRNKFYSKNIHSFIGYAKTQATKYGTKGSRMKEAKEVLDWFDNQLSIFWASRVVIKMNDVDLSTFPTGDHIRFIPADIENKIVAMYEVCQRKLTITAGLQYNRDIIAKFYNEYGKRAKQAESNNGINFKALSHAFRVVYQVKEMFQAGRITFPLPQADFIKKIKYGKLDYNYLSPKLDELIDEVEILRQKSELPEYPDKEFWEQWLIRVVEDKIVPVGKIIHRGYEKARGVDTPIVSSHRLLSVRDRE